MIYTDGAIGSPVDGNPMDFIRADEQLMKELYTKRHFQGGVRLLLSGADVDVMVTGGSYPLLDSLPESAEDQKEISTYKVSAASQVLGNLYPVGRGTMATDRAHFTVVSVPSDRAANTLSEELGRNPGDDVLRFVHRRGALIPGHRFYTTFANGEYGVSAGPYRREIRDILFEHDRTTHAVGVITAPAAFARNVQSDLGLRQNQLRSFIPWLRKPLTIALDTTTVHIGLQNDSIWNLIESGATLPESPVLLDPAIDPDTMQWWKFRWMGVDMDKQPSHWQANREADKILFQNLVELRPTIKALQAERAERQAASAPHPT